MDIKGNNPGPAGRLSNFTARDFIFDGVRCRSIEGVLQAFKYNDPDLQGELCLMVGREAQERGQERNVAWKSTQTLWWQGTAHEREMVPYQFLVDRLYEAVYIADPTFKQDLEGTGNSLLTHRMGRTNPLETVLTESEFLIRLYCLRRYQFIIPGSPLQRL